MAINNYQKNTYKEDADISSKLNRWQVLAASMLGSYHEKMGQSCQDYYHFSIVKDEILVSAVADGASSAAFGQVGAEIAAKKSVESILAKLLSGFPLENNEHLEETMKSAIEKAVNAINSEAKIRNIANKELASTLILCLATPKFVVAAQIGDGAIVIEDEDTNINILTKPQVGEHLNETVFLSTPNLIDKAQINIWHGELAQIAIFSDGLQMLALQMPVGKPHIPFFSPLFQFIANVTDESQAKQDFAKFLSSKSIKDRTDDDFTLLLANLNK